MGNFPISEQLIRDDIRWSMLGSHFPMIVIDDKGRKALLPIVILAKQKRRLT